MIRAYTLVALLLGMALGNFAYAWWFDMSYVRAYDRTFFQGIALLTVWIVAQITPR